LLLIGTIAGVIICSSLLRNNIGQVCVMVYLGLDIGTTNTKAVLLDRAGELLDTVSLPTGSRTDWHCRFSQVLDSFAAKGHFAENQIACSVTGQGGSFVLLDDRFQPVGEPIPWTDLALDDTVRDLMETLGVQDFYRLTGWPPHGWLAACKLREIVAQGALSKASRYVVTVPDAVYARLADRLVTDITSAQITGMADFQRGAWSPDILAWVGIGPDRLARIEAELKVVYEGIGSSWGELTLVTGSHDQYAAMQAAGLAADHSVMLGTGTAWVINSRTPEPVFDRDNFRVHPGRDLLPGGFGTITTLGQIGAGFDRLCQRLGITANSLSGDLLVDPPAEAVQIDVDTGNLDPASTGRVALQRYVEWAAACVRSTLEQMGCLTSLECLIAVGGAMASPVWAQIIANVCSKPVEAIDFPEFTAWGAASHAMMACAATTTRQNLPASAKRQIYQPQRTQAYECWYQRHQHRVGEGRV
jgi:sugar (pentulose or hexulose) kinase